MQDKNAEIQKNSFLGERFEFKYIMDPETAIRVQSYIESFGLHEDAYNKRGSYLVNSYYFDTPTYGDYRDKDGSFLIRKKMRARTYVPNWSQNPEDVWLEIKKKHNMNIKKRRAKINGDIWQSLISNDAHYDVSELSATIPDEKDREGFEEFMYFFRLQLYRPSVIVKYDRTAFLSSFTSPVRITFDRNVVTCRADDPRGEEMMIPVTENIVIMEVKFNQKLPWWFRTLIERFDLRRDDFSKYRNSVAMLRGHYQIEISK